VALRRQAEIQKSFLRILMAAENLNSPINSEGFMVPLSLPFPSWRAADDVGHERSRSLTGLAPGF
jgi:hypothetical protein